MSFPSARSTPEVPDQDTVRRRIGELLALTIDALHRTQPALGEFSAQRPSRDRPSGSTRHGRATLVHVGGLLASARPPREVPDGESALLEEVDRAVRAVGMGDLRSSECQGVRLGRWTRADGDQLEVVVGVRVAVRAISAPFLPPLDDPAPVSGGAAPTGPLRRGPRR